MSPIYVHHWTRQICIRCIKFHDDFKQRQNTYRVDIDFGIFVAKHMLNHVTNNPVNHLWSHGRVNVSAVAFGQMYRRIAQLSVECRVVWYFQRKGQTPYITGLCKQSFILGECFVETPTWCGKPRFMNHNKQKGKRKANLAPLIMFNDSFNHYISREEKSDFQ